MNLQGLTFTDVGFSAACKKGMLVAYDETSGIYIPAAAKWSSTYREDGSAVPEATSYVTGVLITDVVNNSGTVLTDGWIRDDELIYLMTNNLSGDYYLSSDGKAVAGRASVGTLPVYCFSYRKSAESGTAGLLVFRPQPPEYAGHSHGRYTLPSDWILTSTGSSLTISRESAVFEALLLGDESKMSLVKNGLELDPSLWSIDKESDTEIIINTKFSVISGDVLVLHSITPFTAEEPIIRSVAIAEGCNVLKADINSGRVALSLNDADATTGKYTGVGVVSLSNREIATGPVVQTIHPGPGVLISKYSDTDGAELRGSYIISSEAVSKQEHDMFLCNLDGALLGSDNYLTSYVFPAKLQTKIHGNIRVPYIPENRTVTARIKVVVRGTSATMNSLSAVVNKLSMPTEDDSSGIYADNIIELKLQGSVGTDTAKAYLVYADIRVASCDCLAITIRATNPTEAIEVLSVSLSIQE